MLGVLTPEQARTKTAVENHFKMATRIKKPTLEAFIQTKEITFQNLLSNFIDNPRLKRAQQIKDKELTIQEDTDNRIKALIREYHIVIDLENRMVLHDCADWNRVLSNKRFCKHIGKLLLSLDRKKASNILNQIYADKETWEFKPYT